MTALVWAAAVRLSAAKGALAEATARHRTHGDLALLLAARARYREAEQEFAAVEAAALATREVS